MITMLSLQAYRPEAVPGGTLLVGNAPFLLVATGAVLVMRRPNAGLALSSLAQLLQVVGWAKAHSTWLFCAGIFVGVDVRGGVARLFAGWQTSFEFGLGSAGVERASFNVFPMIMCLFFLTRFVQARRDRVGGGA